MAVLTDRLGLESSGGAALAFSFAIDGGHSDLVGRFWFQPRDDDLRQLCNRNERDNSRQCFV